jgi:nucleoside-diphosphate-sugar epimerase
MKEKILITGASGFLGYHLIKAALQRGLDVYAGVRKTSDVKHLEDLPVTFTYLDFSDATDLEREMIDKKYSYIIHAAGTTKARTVVDYNAVNADYTISLARSVYNSGIPVKKFVFISSLAAIGPLSNLSDLITEATVPHPVTNYGRSKLLSENRLKDIPLPVVILRPTAIYGPREKDLFILFKTIKRGIEPYIGRMDQRLSFIYASDVANAAINALESHTSGVYNLSDGNTYDRYDFANDIKLLMKKKTFKFHVPYWSVKLLAETSEVVENLFNKTPTLNRDKLNELTGENWVCNIEKAKRDLNFQPEYDLEEGVRETLNWYEKYKWL